MGEGGQQSTAYVLLNFLHLILWESGAQWFAWSVCLADPWDRSIPVLSRLRLPTCATVPGFYMGTRDPNSVFMLLWQDLQSVNHLPNPLVLQVINMIISHPWTSHALEVPWALLWSWSFHCFCITQGGSLHCCWSLISASVLYSFAAHLCSPMPMTVPFNTKYTRGVHILHYLTILGLFYPFRLQLKLGLAVLGKYSTTGHIPRSWLLRDDLPL